MIRSGCKSVKHKQWVENNATENQYVHMAPWRHSNPLFTSCKFSKPRVTPPRLGLSFNPHYHAHDEEPEWWTDFPHFHHFPRSVAPRPDWEINQRPTASRIFKARMTSACPRYLWGLRSTRVVHPRASSLTFPTIFYTDALLLWKGRRSAGLEIWALILRQMGALRRKRSDELKGSSFILLLGLKTTPRIKDCTRTRAYGSPCSHGV